MNPLEKYMVEMFKMFDDLYKEYLKQTPKEIQNLENFRAFIMNAYFRNIDSKKAIEYLKELEIKKEIKKL